MDRINDSFECKSFKLWPEMDGWRWTYPPNVYPETSKLSPANSALVVYTVGAVVMVGSEASHSVALRPRG